MKKIKILVSVFVVIIAIICYMFLDSVFAAVDKGVKSNFEIQKGQSSSVIAKNLKSESLIKSSFYFNIYMKISGKYKHILPGKFELSDSMTANQIANIITKKLNNIDFDETEIKIIEGWNSIQVAKYLEEKEFCTEKEFFDIIKKKFDYNFLGDKPGAYDLEGYLFPDTYRVYKNASCEDVIVKFLDNFSNKLDDQIIKDIKSQNKTIFEIITMASVVEKEVRSTDDMKIVSGIFWDRIKNGQALESCATLAYILGENKDQYSYEDTRIDSAYNTYRNKGLPPSPIANPGLNAIKAAVYPEYTDYNYFLTDPETSNTVFSKTFEEHKKNKLKYLK